MSRYRVLLTDYAWPDLEIERTVLAQYDAELVVAPDGGEATLAELASAADAIMTNWARVSAAVIDAAANCRIIARLGVGLDSIDVRRATDRSIPITNVPDYCLTEVSEHTLALLLTLARKLHVYQAAASAGRYDLAAGLPLRRIEGQALGLVGFGQIGSRVAAKARAFGLRVVATTRARRALADGVSWLPFDELLAESDYVSLHLPLTDQTRHIIDAAALARMKPTAYLVNTSRGGLVDHAALAAALAADQLAGAALDVQEPEPPDLAQPPFDDPRVLVTPHAAFYSAESVDQLRRRVARQVGERLAGRLPEHVVNPEAFA